MLAALSAQDTTVVVLIVGARLLIPLLIPRWPLMILVAFTLDGIDNGLLSSFTDVDMSADGPYQSWDKALDIYYQSIAYLAAMRNWTSGPAFRIAQFLFFYRLVGVVAFELTHERALLLIFPNTFEFFFIAYELVRLRREPTRWGFHFWLAVAAGLWIFVKLPQEWWIHIAQLDFTETVADHPWFGVASVVVVVGVAAVGWFVARPRMGPPDWPWRIAADPAPPVADQPDRFAGVGEKVVLLALLGVIFTEILPSIDVEIWQVAAGVTLVVFANAAVGIAGGALPLATRFATLLAVNLAFVFGASLLLTGAADFQLGGGLFFAFLFSVVIGLYDVCRPVRDVRAATPASAPSSS
ncbi:MAG: hypothetical protein JHC95_20810 [Solirubrobacteraceae bacterium]|nr:hypothetical protein [Solirubrobacteraceae bacterium]